MKKQLLFAAMLMLSAAPTVSVSAAQPFAAAAEEGQTLATQEQYDALQKSISDLQQNIDAMLKEINEKYADAEDTKNSLEYNKESLDDMAAEVKEKFSAQTLTVAEVEKYQATVVEMAEGLKDAVKSAEQEVYSFQVNTHYQNASMHKSECLGKVPENVQNYYAPSFDDLDADMMQVYMPVMMGGPIESAEKAKEMCAQFDAISAKADSLVASAKLAGTLVDSITATLDSLGAEIAKVKKNFPEYDLSMIQESAEYWKKFAAEFTQAPAEGAAPYTEKQIAGYVENFGYFKDSALGVYAEAQKDEWMAQFNAKYYPASQEMDKLLSTLDAQCPTVGSKYFTQLDDLNVELTQMYMVLYQGELTQESFDEMMARIDAILVEAQKIVDEAIEAEKVATGISDITVNKTVKAGNVYSLDGKRVSKSAKGLVIINGKKVVLK
jgi:Skp family chaperone for outer membrane proteins